MPKILSLASFQLSTARRLRPGPVRGLPAEVDEDSRCRRRFRGIDSGLPENPFFSALPYDSRLTPLSTAFTHFDAGSRGRIPDGSAGPGLSGHSASSNLQTADLQTCQLFSFLESAASCASLCRLQALPNIYFQQFTDTFLQTRGVGAVFSTASIGNCFPWGTPK
jgi:hypothetical protein